MEHLTVLIFFFYISVIKMCFFTYQNLIIFNYSILLKNNVNNTLFTSPY